MSRPIQQPLRQHLALGVAALALLMAACAPPVRETTPAAPPSAVQAPAAFPGQHYLRSAAQGLPIYRIDPARSLITLTVRRGGPLARLGHDHVVASRSTQGFISPQEGRADLYLPLDELTVDEPALRTEAGLDTQPSASDIAATRHNMRNQVLETPQFPFALIHIKKIEHTPTQALLTSAITLRGLTRSYQIAAQVQTQASVMRIDGSMELNQSDFGITPFSVLGGALQVQDRMRLHFKLEASPL